MSASETASRHSHGASMSSTTRSTVPGASDGRQGLDEVADGDGPGRVVPAEEGAAVAAGDLGEVLAPLERQQPAALADGPQQRHGQRAAADAGLDDRRAREDVGHLDDLARVLGVDDGRAARHRHDVVAEQRSQREVLDAGGVRDDGPVVATR